MRKVYFITGAGCGMGVDFTRTALAAVTRWSPPAAVPRPLSKGNGQTKI